MNPDKKNQIKSVTLGIILIGLMAVFQSKHYVTNQKLINDFAEESLVTYEKLLNKQFKNLENVIEFYQKDYKELPRFSKKDHDEIAMKFLFHFDYVLAFNYINSDYVIEHVYPFEANQKALGKDLRNHDDLLIRTEILKGLSKNTKTLLPPVKIFQGGEAVIFYFPVTFKNGEFGWINVVIKTELLFQELIDTNFNYKSNIGLYHKESNRFYFKTGSFNQEKYWFRHPIKVLNQEAVMFIDLKKQILELQNELFAQSIIIAIFIFLFVYLFAQFLRQKEDIFSKYIDIYNEGNLLRVLIHDLGSPLMSLQMSLSETSQENKSTELQIANQSTQTISSIIATIREMLISRVDLKIKNKIDINVLISELSAQNKELIKRNDLKMSATIQRPIFTHAILPEILRNHILNNLLINALNYARKGSTIDIHFDGQFLIIENEADIVPAETLARLNSFQPEDTEQMKKTARGMGVGLFIAKIFCRQFRIGFSVSQNSQNGRFSAKLAF